MYISVDAGLTGFPSDMTTSRGLWPGLAHGPMQEGVQ
jgi:hypothetical protein